MKPSIMLGGGCAVLSMLLSSATLGGALSAVDVQQLAAGTSHPVIVIMRNKFSGAAALSDRVDKHMSPPLPLVGVGEAVESARLALEKADALLVVGDGRPVGVLTRLDLLAFLAR